MWTNEEELGRQLLGYYGYEGGQPAGGFLSSLLGAWEKADMLDRQRLYAGFPELAGLLERFQMSEPETFRAWLDNL